MSLTHEDVARILEIIDRLEGRDVHLRLGDLEIHVTRGDATAPGPEARAGAPGTATPPAQAAASANTTGVPVSPSATPAPQVTIPPGHVAVRAPMVGTFYRASSPGAQPFVEVGRKVAPDDTVCLLEVMKLFTSIKAGVAGRITAIVAANGALVQHDDALILIAPDAA